MMCRGFKISIAAGVAMLAAVAAATTPDAERGRTLFERRCTGCHSLDGIKAGPSLRGVYGRAAGRIAQYPYSEALKGSRVRWDEATLDRWLADPDSLVPGNDMSFRLDSAAERADIVAYLKQLGSK